MPDLTIESLFRTFRSDLDDPEMPGEGDTPDSDSLWSNKDLYSYLNSAQLETSRRTMALRDVLDIPLEVGKSLYTVPEWFLRARYAKTTGDERMIHVVNGDEDFELGDDYGISRRIFTENSEGPAQALVFDEREGKVRVAPKPTIAETIRVFIFRLPKISIEDKNSILTLRSPRYERSLLLYMKKRAYEKEDADLLNSGKSDKYFNEWLAETSSLMSENTKRVRRAGTVRYGGL